MTRYSSMLMKLRPTPRDPPTSITAKVWPVIGTGEPGTGIEIWAETAVRATAATTSPTSRTHVPAQGCSRYRRPARTSTELVADRLMCDLPRWTDEQMHEQTNEQVGLGTRQPDAVGPDRPMLPVRG